MRGTCLSLLGALLGAALWVGVLKIPLPVSLVGLAAAAAGFSTGFGMRLGAPRPATTGQRMLAVALSALAVSLGRYAAFLERTLAFPLDGVMTAPVWKDPATLRYFATTHLFSGWLSPLLFAVAGWFAWSCSRK